METVIRILKYHLDRSPVALVPDGLLRRQEQLPLKTHFTANHRTQAKKRTGQSAFSAAALAHQSESLPRLYLERDPFESLLIRSVIANS